jgi:hypothetical protein
LIGTNLRSKATLGTLPMQLDPADQARILAAEAECHAATLHKSITVKTLRR